MVKAFMPQPERRQFQSTRRAADIQTAESRRSGRNDGFP
jgi:hypothetical protein